jgi:diaminopimelate decarboxylase
MREQGVVVDAVSLGEIERALAAGFSSRWASRHPGDRVHRRPARRRHAGPGGGAGHSGQRRLDRHAAPARPAAPGPCGVAAHQPGLRPRPQQQDQHRRRAQQARHLARRPAAGAGGDPPARPALVGCTCTSARAWTTATWRRSAAPWWTWRAGGRADLQAISAGGGLSIPYRAGEPRSTRRTTSACGTPHAARSRAAVWATPCTWRSSRGATWWPSRACCWRGARHQDVGSNHFVLVDAGFNDLMRPSMYGSHHGISVLRR